MARKNISTGDLLQIPLWGNLGYAYAKYIDLSKYSNMPTLIKVFEYWTQSKGFEESMIEQSKYLVQPMLVAGINPILREKKWEVVGKLNLKADDREIPHFRSHEPRWEEESNAKEWCYIEDCNVDKRVITAFENIKHLERYAAQGTGNIEIKVTMQIIKKENLNVSDYFDMKDETVEYQYGIVQDTPLLSELPEVLHGRAKI